MCIWVGRGFLDTLRLDMYDTTTAEIIHSFGLSFNEMVRWEDRKSVV